MIELNTGRWIYTVQWSSPYSEPPSGPRIIAWGQARTPGPDPELEKKVWSYAQPGYSTYIILCGKNPKLLTPEKLAQMRFKRKQAYYRRKYPLLADQMFEADQKKRPEYYSVDGCLKHQQHRSKTIQDLDAEFVAKFPRDREIKV